MKTSVLGFLLLLIFQAQAARPTVNASNLYASNIECISAVFSWSNGNGNARLVVAREGSPVAFVPSDNTVYSQYSSAFGTSTPPGIYNNEFILTNIAGFNNFKITNLKPGTTYYITMYEHDNNGSNTLYLTSGAATYSFTTASINQSFNIKVNDSCQYSNSFEFTNTSTHTIPGLVFYFEVESKPYNADQPLTYKYKTASGYASVILKNNNTLGCPTSLSKYVKIYPKRVTTFDFANSTDTVQDFKLNSFKIRVKGLLMPFPLAISYQWDDGLSNTSYFSTFQKKYPDPGRYHTQLISTIHVNSQTTNCRDTMYLDLVVTGIDPFRSLSITPDSLLLKDNLFSFSLNDTGLKAVKWYFGDAQTSTDSITTHHYTNVGTYRVMITATTKSGISDTTYKTLIVMPDMGDTTSILKPHASVLKIFPNPTQDHLFIQFNRIDHYTLQLTQLDGKICMEYLQNKLLERINVSNFSSGIYLLNILKNGQKIETFHIKIE